MNKRKTNVLSVKHTKREKWNNTFSLACIFRFYSRKSSYSNYIQIDAKFILTFVNVCASTLSFNNLARGCVHILFTESINPIVTRDTTVSWDSRITISTINVARRAATSPDAALSNLLWDWRRLGWQPVFGRTPLRTRDGENYKGSHGLLTTD